MPSCSRQMHTSWVLNYVYNVKLCLFKVQFTRVKEVNYSDQPFSFNLMPRPFQPTSVLLTISRGDRLHHTVSTFYAENVMDIRNIFTPRYNIIHFRVINSRCSFLIIKSKANHSIVFINKIILRGESRYHSIIHFWSRSQYLLQFYFILSHV